MKKAKALGLCLSLAMSLAACSHSRSAPGGGGENTSTQTPPDKTGLSGFTKVQAVIQIDMNGDITVLDKGNAQIPISIVNPSNVKFTVSMASFKMPTVSNALLSFGRLVVSDLFDNDLSVCGQDGKTKCTKAYLQMYTIGVGGAGVWNPVLNWGAPITAGLDNNTMMSVGLNQAYAAVLQTFTIPAGQNVLRLTDFTDRPNYQVKADFTNAGAGSYSTTLVLEYGVM